MHVNLQILNLARTESIWLNKCTIKDKAAYLGIHPEHKDCPDNHLRIDMYTHSHRKNLFDIGAPASPSARAARAKHSAADPTPSPPFSSPLLEGAAAGMPARPPRTAAARPFAKAGRRLSVRGMSSVARRFSSPPPANSDGQRADPASSCLDPPFP